MADTPPTGRHARLIEIDSKYCDTTTGVHTFLVAPAVGVAVTADFEFDVLEHFDTDSMTVTLEQVNLSHLSQWAVPIAGISV